MKWVIQIQRHFVKYLRRSLDCLLWNIGADIIRKQLVEDFVLEKPSPKLSLILQNG